MKNTDLSDCDQLVFHAETDLKSQFLTTILLPLLKSIDKTEEHDDLFEQEQQLILKGISGAVFENIVFEIKKYNHFNTSKGINEALFGRNNKDHGLYDYIIDLAKISLPTDNEQTLVQKISHQIGVGFDGKRFIFARFAITLDLQQLEVKKGSTAQQTSSLKLPLKFTYEVFDLEAGIERLKILIRQRNKISLNKESLTRLLSPKQEVIRENVNKIYHLLQQSFNEETANQRVITLYNEWDRVFGVLYGSEEEQTDFVNYIEPLK